MIILIDFDDVVFNTKKFREDLRTLFLSNGISKDLYEKTYYDVDDERVIKTYDPEKQIVRICKMKGRDMDMNGLRNSLDSFLGSIEKYVFDDVISFMNEFAGDDVNIVSYGDAVFQKKKIDGSGIAKYCRDVIITERLKSRAVYEIMKKNNIDGAEKTVFIDDRNEQIEDVKKRFPFVTTILLKRPEGRYQEMGNVRWCDYEVRSLDEVKNLIKEIRNN
jgi:FMN phosphatase YigB (HAD superfamily)